MMSFRATCFRDNDKTISIKCIQKNACKSVFPIIAAFTCCDAELLNGGLLTLRGTKLMTDSVFSRLIRWNSASDWRILTGSCGRSEFPFLPIVSRLATKSVNTGSPFGRLRWNMALDLWIFCAESFLAGEDCWSNTAEWRLVWGKKSVFSRRKLRTKLNSRDGSLFGADSPIICFWFWTASKLFFVKIVFFTWFSSFNWLFMSSIFRFSWYAKLSLGASNFRVSILLIDERSGKNFSKFHSRNRTSSFSEVVDVDDPVVATDDDDWLARFYLNFVFFVLSTPGGINSNDRNDN